MTKSLDRQHAIRNLAKKMIENRNNYKKILKEIEAEAKSLLNMSGATLYQIALQLNANHVLKNL